MALAVAIRGSDLGPSSSLTNQHLFNGRVGLPSFESTNAVVEADCCGATPDAVQDSSQSLSKCLDLASKVSSGIGGGGGGGGGGVCVLGRGIYRLSETLVVPPGVSLVGAGLHLTSLVPSSTDFLAGSPVLRTTGGATVVMGA